MFRFPDYPGYDLIVKHLRWLDARNGYSVGARFITKIEVGEPPWYAPQLGPCILWTKAVDSRGYGVFRGISPEGESKLYSAYLWLYHQFHPEGVPEGYELHHECHDEWRCAPQVAKDCPHRPCVNHVRPITVYENRSRDTRIAQRLARQELQAKEYVLL